MTPRMLLAAKILGAAVGLVFLANVLGYGDVLQDSFDDTLTMGAKAIRFLVGIPVPTP